jgi:H+-transporting ATPase
MKSDKIQHKATKSKTAAPPAPEDDLKTLPIAEVEKKLDSLSDGLTGAEAQKRLMQYGPNELEEKKTNMFPKFLSYFWGPIPWMIEAAVILSGVARHWPDFFIILLLLFAKAIVGFWEERQAGNAIEALKAKLAINARVKKDVRIIQLLEPAFDNSSLNPGYIKGYVPGVSENGGQYTDAAVWKIRAFA